MEHTHPPRPPDPRRGVPCPSPDPRPHVRHLLFPNDRTLTVVGLGDVVWGSEVHWHQGRSHYCRGEDASCAWCTSGHRSTWQGWLPVVIESGRVPYLLVVPRAAYQHSPTLQAADGRLRGLAIQVGRRGTGRSAPAVATVTGPSHQTALPAAPDLLAALERMWSLPVGTIWVPPAEDGGEHIIPLAR